jgi:hypothetical protein
LFPCGNILCKDPEPGDKVKSELKELTQQLRSKRFSLDDVRPLMEQAAHAIDRLQSENLALLVELRHYQAIEARLQKAQQLADALLRADGARLPEQLVQELAALLDMRVSPH